jgi:uncharacterized protein with ParB-like and HNH nuclease domain
MSNTASKPKELTIKALLSNDKYIVPIYQRNYSWKEGQIMQLLQDVWDKHKDNSGSRYYIGTLIVDKHDNGFEVIDGQQRYTTIILINAIIHKNFDKLDSIDQSNLEFDARREVKEYIKFVYSNGYDKNKILQESECRNIRDALGVIKTFLEKKRSEDSFDGYIKYFYNNVKIIRINVPDGTDVNHYFEIMNTRGEQLEAHEILKAWLYKHIGEENKSSFAKIWEACSQIGVRIQTCFSKDENRNLFGEDFSVIPNNGVELLKSQAIEEKITLKSILDSHILPRDFTQTNKNQSEEKYRSVIDFPNFLLIALRIYLSDDNDISLDDKNLLKEKGFGYTTKNLKVNPEKFGSFLLKCRVVFDNYIIKQEDRDGKTEWYIHSPKLDSDDKIYWVNTFGKEDEEEEEVKKDDFFGLKDMIMLQTMLQVSYPGNSYKDWLYKVLSWLTKQDNIEYPGFMKELTKIVKSEYKGNSPFTYHYVERFIFNLLDYLLWKEYKNENAFVQNYLNNNSAYEKYIVNFRFRGGNSIEHLLPRSKKAEIQSDNQDEILDSFGNLCLISNGNNSKYSDLGFEAKKEQFLKQSNTESLKQTIMFSYGKWNTEEIREHEEMMMDLLKTFVKDNNQLKI